MSFNRLLDILLAFAVVMSAATQLDLPVIDLTVGEASLALWIVLAVVDRLSVNTRTPVSVASTNMKFFWSAFIVLLTIGFTYCYMTRGVDLSSVIHDSIAYVLMAMVTNLATSQDNVRDRLYSCSWYLVTFASIAYILQLIESSGLYSLPGVEPWYFERLRGWSQNPNQLALYSAIFVVIALYLASIARKTLTLVLAIISMIVPAYVGYLSQSDTFKTAVLAALAVYVCLRLVQWVSHRTPEQLAVTLVAAVGAVMIVGAVDSAVTYNRGNDFEVPVLSTADTPSWVRNPESTERRLQLWSEAIDAGFWVAVFGLGPGPHLETRPESEPSFTSGPFEAHNTYLDIYLQGGLLALVLYLWLGGSALVGNWRNNQPGLVVLVLTLGIFSLTHLVLRHPIVWYAIALCLVMGSRQFAQSSRQTLFVPRPIHLRGYSKQTPGRRV